MAGRWIGAAVVAAALALAGPVRADYAAGQAAWDAGRPAAAAAEWRKAADGGDSRAMLALGRLYAKGLGAPQDYVLAHMWLNLAASRGAMEAVEERDALAARMTPAQVATAQERAAAWQPGEASPDGETDGAAAPAAAPSASDAGPPPPRAIREAQELLAALGYDPGPADGVWGFGAAVAYRAFLRDAGLPASKTLTPDALRTLRRAAKGGTSAPAAPAAAPPRADAVARAASRGDVDGLNAALAAGADPDARDARGRTALMYAADKGYTLLVEPLLAAGADPDVRAADGATALFMAAVRGNAEVVSLLSQADADVSITGPQGRTAVDAARARYGDLEAARTKGANPAVLALLAGKTLAGMAREEEERREAEARRKAEEEKRAEERRKAEARRQAEERRRRGAIEGLVEKMKEDRPWLFGRDCPECPEMVAVPAGAFDMGSPPSEKGRDNDEGPVRRVTISEPFAVGKYEVTFAEWDSCVSAGGCGGHRPDDRGWGRGDRPVINVSWDDAQAYVAWLREKTGKRYRLLSESEWEYLARAGSTTRYWWGDGVGRNRANCNGCGSRWDGRQTAPVGSFGATNGFGLHDVHGNVREWVADCWNGGYAGAPSDGSAWESGNCSRRVLRGGSWYSRPWLLRSANRLGIDAGDRNDHYGFRVARTLAP